MLCSISEIRSVIREALKERSNPWIETEDGDFRPNLEHFPGVAYHGTSPESAKTMLQGFKTDGIDFAFDKALARSYGQFKSKHPVVLALNVRKLRPYQWAGPDNSQDGIAMNYDIGDDGFTFFGEVPKGALTIVKEK